MYISETTGGVGDCILLMCHERVLLSSHGGYFLSLFCFSGNMYDFIFGGDLFC